MTAKTNIWVASIEPLEQRYTGEWHKHLPKMLEKALPDVRVRNIDGILLSNKPTPGAFLNFGATNVWKSEQAKIFSEMFTKCKIKNGDHIIFTDAWNVNVLAVRYMIDLLKINVTLHGLWHAGSYDPEDFLGRAMGGSDWVTHSEQGMFYAYDHNYFATDFHIDMFLQNLFGYKGKTLSTIKDKHISSSKIVRSGWPMEYLPQVLNKKELIKIKKNNKKDMIIFPHRLSSEKQVNIFNDLARSMPDVEFIICQDKNLSKEDYHKLLASAKLLFSASLQETLGISPIEGLLLDVVPVLPNRLSYTEMYDKEFLYPSKWTTDYSSYLKYKSQIKDYLYKMLKNYDSMKNNMKYQSETLMTDYFSSGGLISTIKSRLPHV